MKCNMCGKELELTDVSALHAHSVIGYGSKYDGDKIDLNLCCDCCDIILDYILPKCKISPLEENYLWRQD